MKSSWIGLSIAFAAGVFGCSSSPSADKTDAGAKGDGATSATFEDFYSGVILSYHCQDCHVPGKIGVTEGNLDMSTPQATFANLVNQKAAGTVAGSSGKTCKSSGLTRVIPGNTADSLIIQKTELAVTNKEVREKMLTSPVLAPCGSEMPLGCPTATLGCLGPMDVDTLTSWINGGAPAPVTD
jgi:hypothetical protein